MIHVSFMGSLQLKEMDDVDMMTLVIQEMSKEFPTLMETLLHERDQLVFFSFTLSIHTTVDIMLITFVLLFSPLLCF